MTPAELEHVLRTETPERFTQLILPLLAHENKSLAKTVTALRRKAKEELAALYTSRRVFSSDQADLRMASEYEARVQLAVLAFCPWTDARKVPSFIFTWGRDHQGGRAMYSWGEPA